MRHIVQVWNIGRINYKPALLLQNLLSKDYKEAVMKNEKINRDVLLLVEHSPVYTIGIRAKGYENEELKLRNLGADFERTDRGGLITFHGPGQLVVYPIVNLKNMFIPGLRHYVCSIESTVIEMCKYFGIVGDRSPNTGVWVGDNKICAIGIHASRYITTHGLAVNCNTDLSWFNHITPCGIEGKGVTSLTKELGRETTIQEVIPYFLRSFADTFYTDYEDVPKCRAQTLLNELEINNVLS